MPWSMLAAVTARSPLARLCPIAPAGRTCRPLCNRLRSSRRRSVSAEGEFCQVKHGELDRRGRGLFIEEAGKETVGSSDEQERKRLCEDRDYSHNAVP